MSPLPSYTNWRPKNQAIDRSCLARKFSRKKIATIAASMRQMCTQQDMGVRALPPCISNFTSCPSLRPRRQRGGLPPFPLQGGGQGAACRARNRWAPCPAGYTSISRSLQLYLFSVRPIKALQQNQQAKKGHRGMPSTVSLALISRGLGSKVGIPDLQIRRPKQKSVKD